MRVQVDSIAAAKSKRWVVLRISSEKTLNSLDREIIDELHLEFQRAAADENVVGVFLEGAGEKAFCAGGDVRSLYNPIVEARKCGAPFPDSIRGFFTAEYALDSSLYGFEKPIIAWANGITMGGGLGLIMGTSHRVATPSTLMAMPEVAIGLYPDVGATWFLNQLEPSLAKFIGMTGVRLAAAEALALGWVQYMLPADLRGSLKAELAKAEWTQDARSNRNSVDGILKKFQTKPEKPSLLADTQWIEKVFGKNTVPEILDAIDKHTPTSPFLKTAVAGMQSGCPASVFVAHEQVNRFRNLSRPQAFEMELALSVAMTERPDFVEGVRAVLVDKDRNPKWQPAIFAASLYQELGKILDGAASL